MPEHRSFLPKRFRGGGGGFPNKGSKSNGDGDKFEISDTVRIMESEQMDTDEPRCGPANFDSDFLAELETLAVRLHRNWRQRRFTC